MSDFLKYLIFIVLFTQDFFVKFFIYIFITLYLFHFQICYTLINYAINSILVHFTHNGTKPLYSPKCQGVKHYFMNTKVLHTLLY